MLEFSHFDRRRYPIVSVREGYREWLPSYQTTVANEMANGPCRYQSDLLTFELSE